MAEYTAIATQTVAVGQDVLLTETAVRGNLGMYHREGSGIVNLRGIGTQCRALYQIDYSGNIAVATGGTASAISLAIAVEGEALGSAVGIATPAAVGDFFNVSMSAQVAVPRGCCSPVSIMNNGTQAIDVANSNLVITRIA